MEYKKNAQICNLNLHSVPNDVIHKIVEDCSTLTKIVRSLAYCFRFISNCRKSPDDRILIRSSMSELTETHQAMIKYSQNLHFKKDVIQLRNHKQLIRTSQLQQLHAFLDENGILKVSGCLYETPSNFARKHITTCQMQDNSAALLLASIRRQYWPLNARNLIRQICRACVWCVKNNPKRLIQAMGSLPADRSIQPSRAFLISGVDFVGPVVTLVNKGCGRKMCKSYIALFVCFAIKAVHLEAVSELSTAALLAALQRFVGRRELPRKICSDNTTNFVGADCELEEFYSFVRTSIDRAVGDTLQEMNIEWSFIPPYSPHLGGVNNGVSSNRSLLELQALVAFIVGSFGSTTFDCRSFSDRRTFNEPTRSGLKLNRLDRWESIQRAVQGFWQRLATEYIANLQSRTKWKKTKKNLKINDFVLLQEDNLPPLKWKSDRVIETLAGKDGLVRVATVRTANGIVKRAITKLCKLPVDK
ncbi:uncharacterized protein LOC105205341 [Solenopsis invicta]|uniref:uncharacterized protein LOC105205341 n=1 Tax=Solenopsis invicta TaxID=13686 RepID=UPI0005962CC1|nr:uncharacterized protein LOC105205341 [Solenopsis invicta]